MCLYFSRSDVAVECLPQSLSTIIFKISHWTWSSLIPLELLAITDKGYSCLHGARIAIICCHTWLFFNTCWEWEWDMQLWSFRTLLVITCRPVSMVTELHEAFECVHPFYPLWEALNYYFLKDALITWNTAMRIFIYPIILVKLLCFKQTLYSFSD